MDTRLIEQASIKLKNHKGSPIKTLIGFDGFVDEIIHVVDTRQDLDNYTRINTIADFAARIKKAAGLSANIEFVSTKTKLGGNGPIFANALLNAGLTVTYIGSVGAGAGVHPVFAAMAKRALTYPVCAPGFTDALEFTDGKIMLGKHSTLKDITWDNILNAIGGIDRFTQMLSDVDLLGMENWTMLPYMSDIWRHIIDTVLPLMPNEEDINKRPIAFFDLADPEKRARDDIIEAMELIGRFEGKLRAVLGLNEKEIYEIADAFGIPKGGALQSVIESVYNKLNIYCLTVHPVKEALACTKEGCIKVDGPYCAAPILTTGAGDNYNAGFCLGLSLGFDMITSLTLGAATSGFYVRNAASPSRDELIDFLQAWAGGELK